MEANKDLSKKDKGKEEKKGEAIDKTNKPEEEEIDLSLLEKAYDSTFQNVMEGQIVQGTVIQITGNEVLIDVGYKSEGIVPISEFRSLIEEKGLKAGDKVDVFLEKAEDADGMVVISKEKADKIKIWDQINKAYETGEIIEGKVIEKIKGGLTVDIGVKAFLPGSQIDLKPIKDLDSLIGQKLRMKVIKLNKRRGNIVLSRRAVLEEEKEQAKKQTLQHLAEGAIVKGIVKNITEYGVFVDLGGIDGLLHITDMSWGRVNHPSELVSLGQEIEVVVLKLDLEKERVSLGMKQKTEDPWLKVEERYPIGSKVKGKVISLTDYGAFVKLEDGVEGLIHISEMSWTKRVKHPSKVLEVDDIVEAVVLDIDPENKKISLGLKQAEPNPWDTMEERYPVGTKVTGKVRNITTFGAFVELEDGIDGLIHISDMSWTQRIRHPSEILKKGDIVEAVVLDIDPKNERISLGLKQAQENPWDTIDDRYRIGQEVKGKITRTTEFGAFVELEDGIEGLVHISELERKKIDKIEDFLKIGEEKVFRINRIDPVERRISLSLKSAFEDEAPPEKIKEYLEQSEKEKTSLEDKIKDTETLKALKEIRNKEKPEIEEKKEESDPE